jgi:hypothetical protein
MPPNYASSMRQATARLLTQKATVYAEDQVSGRYTVVVHENLACRLIRPGGDTQTQEARAELFSARDLYWDATYEMAETAQVEIEGERWQPRAGTFQPLTVLPDSGTPVVWRCIAVRITSAG